MSHMTAKCTACGTLNTVPSATVQYRCYNCHAFLPKPTPPPGDTSAAVGVIGGAMLGAAIGGPVGALVGGIIGGIVGKDSKGLG